MLHCLLPTSWVPPLTPPNAKMLEGKKISASRPMPLIRAFILWRELIIVQMSEDKSSSCPFSCWPEV